MGEDTLLAVTPVQSSSVAQEAGVSGVREARDNSAAGEATVPLEVDFGEPPDAA
jgi:hypothetical protein